MSRKFRPDQCPKCSSLSRTQNIKYPSLIETACEGVKGGYSTSHAEFKGKTSRSCPDFEPKAEGK